MAVLLIILGLVTLVIGAEVLVRGASRLAGAVGLPSLIIGLTVVAFGTSAPELTVSVQAALAGQADIALGNVVGSNTLNILLILGISATIIPLAVSAQLIRLDTPIMIAVSGLVWWLAADGVVGRVEGACLAAGLVFYTAMLVFLGRRKQAQSSAEVLVETVAVPRGPKAIAWNGLLVLVGLGLLVLGARWLVRGAVDLAESLGVSDLLIGLTIVSLGTSMPEVATSVVASIRGERDLAVGNVVGSNLFNLLGVLGASAAISNQGIRVAPEALNFDIPVMVAVALACLPIFFTGGRISRWEGVLFLGYYVAYVAFLVLAATRHEAVQAFGSIMLAFVIPISALGVVLSVVFGIKKLRQPAP